MSYEFPICTMLTAQESNRNAQRVTSAGAENAEGRQKNRTPSRPSAEFKICDFCNGSGYALNVITLERRPCPQCKGEGGETVSSAAQTAADAGDAHATPESRPVAQSASPDFYPPERRIRDRQLADHMEFMEGA